MDYKNCHNYPVNKSSVHEKLAYSIQYKTSTKHLCKRSYMISCMSINIKYNTIRQSLTAETYLLRTILDIKSEVLTTVFLRTLVFWDMTLLLDKLFPCFKEM